MVLILVDRFLGLLVVRDIGKAASWWFAIPSIREAAGKGQEYHIADDQESKASGAAAV